MKLPILAAASSLALTAFLISSPVSAQGSYPTPSGDRVDANGMPTTHSTPAEQAETEKPAALATKSAADRARRQPRQLK